MFFYSFLVGTERGKYTVSFSRFFYAFPGSLSKEQYVFN